MCGLLVGIVMREMVWELYRLKLSNCFQASSTSTKQAIPASTWGKRGVNFVIFNILSHNQQCNSIAFDSTTLIFHLPNPKHFSLPFPTTIATLESKSISIVVAWNMLGALPPRCTLMVTPCDVCPNNVSCTTLSRWTKHAHEGYIRLQRPRPIHHARREQKSKAAKTG